MKFVETCMTTAGVFRCCLNSIRKQFNDNDEVTLKQEARCEHCLGEFRLISDEAAPKPIWLPLWQLEQPAA
jgi:hypothetical protein